MKFAVHRLVAEAWHGPCAPGMTVSHLDGDRTNNHFSNLAFETIQANLARREEHGTLARGARVGTSKLTEAKVREIRGLYPELTQQAIGDRFGISQTMVSKIVRREWWAHVE